jgi:hypothetical protein
MAELRFLGLSQDGSQLLLADSRGRKHSVSVDSRLMAAMRLDGQPTGQREIALNTTFSPRQIQARLRTGATVGDLAEEYGVPVDKIERFSGPPLADRAFTSDQARRTVISSHLGDRPLDVVVASAVEASGLEPEEIRWDAWLREDGQWQVLSSYPSGNLDQVATWIFDPRESIVRADDDTARALLVGPDGRRGVEETPSAPREPKAVATAPDQVSEETPDPARSAGPEGGLDAQSETTRPAKRGRRASVPTWDEILFGSNAED